MNELLRRKAATEITLARFRDAVFSWEKGITCVHFAHEHLRNMGHEPPPLPCIRSPVGARRAMTKRGWRNVMDMLDAVLGKAARIPPARMKLGDLAVTPDIEGPDGKPAVAIGSVNVCAGPHKLLGWHEAAPSLVVLDIELTELFGVWRV